MACSRKIFLFSGMYPERKFQSACFRHSRSSSTPGPCPWRTKREPLRHGARPAPPGRPWPRHADGNDPLRPCRILSHPSPRGRIGGGGMTAIGYARVSTDEQDARQQQAALRAAGCTRIFTDTASGASRARPALGAALAATGPGDVLVCPRLDRLARSLAHLLDIVETLAARGAGFRSLADPVDTTSAQGRLTLQILGAVAEFERALIRERTRAGMAAARARGARPGNPALACPAGRRALAASREAARTGRLIREAGDLPALLDRLRPATP